MKKLLAILLSALFVFSCTVGPNEATTTTETEEIGSQKQIVVKINDGATSRGSISVTEKEIVKAVVTVTSPDGTTESKTWEKFGINKLTFTSQGPGNYQIDVTETDSTNNASSFGAPFKVKKGVNTILSITPGSNIIVDITPSITRDGLVAEYLFNGNTADSSGNSNDGVVTGAPTLTNDRNGNPNSAYSFDGIDDTITIANHPALNPTDAITVSAWYKPTISFANGGSVAIVDKPAGTHNAPYYQYNLNAVGDQWPNSPKAFAFAVGLEGRYEFVSTGENYWQLGTLYHIVGTYDGASIKLYINGALVAEKAATGKMSDLGRELNIGVTKNLGNLMPGEVDDVRIYSRALSAEEINTLYTL